MNLIDSLQTFDGKQTATLEQLNRTLPRDETSLAQLFALAKHNDTKLSVGATWILKRWFEDGEIEFANVVSRLIHILKNTNHWEVRLHILQMLDSSTITGTYASVLKKVLSKMVVGDNKFIRAWSVSVLATIADQNATLRDNFISTLQTAELDDAASVRARVRQVRKRYKWIANSERTKR